MFAQTVIAGARIGQTAMKRLYRRARNLRIPPFAIAAIITYLETHRNTCPEGLVGCVPLEREVEGKLNYLYGKAFSSDLLNPNKDFAYGTWENGWLFHLAVLAYYQLSFETGNTAHQPIVVESNMSVQLRKKTLGQNLFQDAGKPYQRSSDIVLFGEGGTDGRVLIETKSYKRPVNKSYYKQWDLSKGKKLRDGDGNDRSNHKQYFLDRVATTDLSYAGIAPLAGDFKWWFHDFNRATINGYRSTEVNQAMGYLKKLPTSRKIGSNSLGLDKGNPSANLAGKAASFGLKALLLEQFRTRLFDGIEDDVYTNLVTNSTHDL
jgi:hypothetical protein